MKILILMAIALLFLILGPAPMLAFIVFLVCISLWALGADRHIQSEYDKELKEIQRKMREDI